MTEQLNKLISSNKIEVISLLLCFFFNSFSNSLQFSFEQNLQTILKELNTFLKDDPASTSSSLSMNGRNKSDDQSFVIYLLLNRIFGEETTGSVNSSITATWTKGKIGGWLKEVGGIKSTNYGKPQQLSEAPVVSGFSTSSLQRNYGLSMDAIHLLNLFSADPNADRSLLKVMTGLNRYDEINLALLPQKIQWKFLSSPEYEYVQTSNHSLYDSWYVELRYDQVTHSLSLSLTLHSSLLTLIPSHIIMTVSKQLFSDFGI